MMSMQNQLTKDTSQPAARVVIVMGVSGCGKSTVGALLAARVRWEFEDGDWLHPAANVEKMHSGIPLTDEDRWPWLDAVAAWIDCCRHSRRHGVVACSSIGGPPASNSVEQNHPRHQNSASAAFRTRTVKPAFTRRPGPQGRKASRPGCPPIRESRTDRQSEDRQ